jgi:hypothetical protein
VSEIFDPLSPFGLQNSFWIGAGPSQTVSRSAIIAESIHSNSTSLSPLDVRQPKYYAQFVQTTGKFNVGPISSIAQPLSSLIGLLGDYGVFGLIFFLIIYFIPLIKLNKKSSIGNLSLTILFLLFLVPLSYFNTFLEFPQAVFPFAILLKGISYHRKNLKFHDSDGL